MIGAIEADLAPALRGRGRLGPENRAGSTGKGPENGRYQKYSVLLSGTGRLARIEGATSSLSEGARRGAEANF